MVVVVVVVWLAGTDIGERGKERERREEKRSKKER